MSGRRLIGDIINCGYARVAIRMLTNKKEHDKAKRRKQFLALFKCPAGYIDDMSYFDEGDNVHDTKFDWGCQQIVKRFNMKWYPNES